MVSSALDNSSVRLSSLNLKFEISLVLDGILIPKVLFNFRWFHLFSEPYLNLLLKDILYFGPYFCTFSHMIADVTDAATRV